MYQLTYDSKILFDPYMQSTAITDAKYTGKSNSVSYLDFSIAPNHPLYNTIEKDKGLVEFYSDNVLKFRGKINEIEIDDYGYKIVACNSVLQYLNHTRVRSYSTVPGDADLTAPTSVEGYFQWLIDQHNLHVKDASERFEVGVNQGAALDKNDYILRSNDNYPTTLDEINDKVLESLGGYLFVEYKDDRNILNLYADVHSTNSQIIDFGSNILSISYKENDDELYTVVIPRGGTPEKKEGDTKDPKPINIKNLPDNTFDTDSDIVKSGDCVYSLSATKRYGYREYYYSNNDILDPSNLLKAAVLQLRLQMSPKVTIETKAIDLSIAYPGYEQLNIGDACRVRSARHNLDDYFMLSEMELDLNDPSQTTYTFGDEYVSLVGRQSNYLKQINSSIDRNYEDVNTAMSYGKAAAKLADTANKTADAANNTAVKANDKAQKATEDAFNANTTANKAQSTANTAKDTANKAQSTATSASKTANSAMSKATTVEQTANGLSTKITEQGKTLNATVTTANEAKSTADSNKAAISQVSTTASSALTKASSVEQNLNGFKTTVAETYTTKNDFNDLTIGGRNLLLNSNFSKGTDNWVLELQSNGLGTVKAQALSGFAFATTMLTIDVTKNTSGLCRIYQLRSPNPMRTDTVDTVSFWATASETVPVQFGRNDDKRFITVQEGWHYYKATVPKWKGSNAFVIGFKNGFIGTLKITNIMWEHASKASQWSPAPEDLQPAGDYSTKSYVDQTAKSVALGVVQNYKGADGSGLATKSDITVAKDSITTTVSETYQTKDDMKNYATQSQLTQTNDKVTIAFQNSQSVGGQNLLLKTSVPTIVKGTEAANQCVAFYSLAVGSLKNLPVGMYHLQFKIKSDTAGGTAIAQWNTTPWSVGGLHINIETTEKTYSVNYYISNNNYPNAKQMSVRLDNAKGNVTIREMKLEPGNSMTPWTAAPEDTINDLINTVQNQATDIANKVSNDDYTGYVNATNKNLSDIQDSQQHLSDSVNNEIKLRESYIQFGQDKSNPYMDMGNSSSPNKMRLTNTKLSFTSNNIEVASVSNDKMRISNAEVLQSFRIGNFVWQPRSDGHMALKYSPEV